jgi:hypothetical protein
MLPDELKDADLTSTCSVQERSGLPREEETL